MPPVEGDRGALLVAGLESHESELMLAGVVKQRLQQCISDAGATMLRCHEEALEFASAALLELKPTDAN